MPTINPAMAANTAPTTSASTSRTAAEGTALCRLIAVITPEKAPMLIKPACPRLSSPRMPTVRFSDTAITM